MSKRDRESASPGPRKRQASMSASGDATPTYSSVSSESDSETIYTYSTMSSDSGSETIHTYSSRSSDSGFDSIPTQSSMSSNSSSDSIPTQETSSSSSRSSSASLSSHTDTSSPTSSEVTAMNDHQESEISNQSTLETTEMSNRLPTPQSQRETSIASTIHLPPHIINSKDNYSGTLSIHCPAEKFPWFISGDLIIMNALESTPKRAFRLHSCALSRHSTWFAKSLADMDPQDAHPKMFLYTLEEVDGEVKLVRQIGQNDGPALQYALLDDTNSDVEVKQEDITNAIETPPSTKKTTPTIRMPMPSTSAPPPTTHNQPLTTYTQLLALIYHQPPTLPSTIPTLLPHAEHLTKLATHLGLLPLLRPHLNAAFTAHRHALYNAIKLDPPRWINVSIPLQDHAIYDECLIHLVGTYPSTPSSWPTSRNKIVDEGVQKIVEKKAKELEQEVLRVERDLLLTTIFVLGEKKKKRPVSMDDERYTETWLLVQIFRDTLASTLLSLHSHSSKPSIPSNEELGSRSNSVRSSQYNTLKLGSFFRQIARGGSAYLPYEGVRDRCEKLRPTGWRDLGGDLEALKGYARDMVEGLARNELVGGVGGGKGSKEGEVGWLTCVRVEEGDVVWEIGIEE